ncbi:MAG: hypothetical protein PVF54_09965 [Anaerolineae bacterium]
MSKKGKAEATPKTRPIAQTRGALSEWNVPMMVSGTAKAARLPMMEKSMR